MSNIMLTASLEGYNRLKDGSYNLRFNAINITSEKLVVVDSMCQQIGIVYFDDKDKPNMDNIKAIQDTDIDFDEGKSPSQRLRAVIYIMWSQTDRSLTFEAFYRGKMESIIESQKAKLL